MAYEIDMMSPEAVAEKYGGNKRDIGQAVQMGLLDPTVGVMAGMFIDRMRAAAIKEQQPTATVAQETLPTVAAAPAGLGATPVAQQVAPQMAAAAPAAFAPAPVRAAGGGLADLPVPDDMVPNEYAGGGIVAFSDEGFVDPIFSAPGEDPYARDRAPSQYESFTGDMTLPELQEYYRSGKVPDRLKGKEPTGFGSRGAPLIGGGYRGFETPRTPASPPAAKGKEESKTDRVPPSAADSSADVSAGKASATPKEETDYAAMVENLKKRFGVTDDAEAKGREALAKYREKLTSDIDKAGALGMIQAGLGIAGGKSRYALQNLAGAAPGITEYAKSMEKLRGEERGILDSEIKLDQAADARRRGDMATALKLEQDAKELAVRERAAAAQERAAGRPGAQTEYVMAYAKSKGISFDQAAKEIAELQGEARNPLMYEAANRIKDAMKGGKSQIDIRDLLEKYPGVVPTR